MSEDAGLDDAPVTLTLVALNIAIFFVEVAGSPGRGVMGPFDSAQLLRLGAIYPLATIGENRWETLVTSCFLHGGLVHLAVNMVALWWAGPIFERAVGPARMATMYLTAGAFGGALSVARGWFTRTALPTVGASGALSGLFAAGLVAGLRLQGWRGPLSVRMGGALLFVAFLATLSSIVGAGTDNASHLGGAIAGVVIALVWRLRRPSSPRAVGAGLAACLGVLLTCVAAVAWRDSRDRFSPLTMQARFDFTAAALAEGRCADASDGLRAVERLRGGMAPATSLRAQVSAVCGNGAPPLEMR